MVNQYRRGARAEIHVRDQLGVLGFDVIRSARSAGAADLVAVGDNTTLFVQVKLGEHGNAFTMPSPAERRELLRIARRGYGGHALVVCHVPGAGGRRSVTLYRALTGEGFRDWIDYEPKEQAGARDRTQAL